MLWKKKYSDIIVLGGIWDKIGKEDVRFEWEGVSYILGRGSSTFKSFDVWIIWWGLN